MQDILVIGRSNTSTAFKILSEQKGYTQKPNNYKWVETWGGEEARIFFILHDEDNQNIKTAFDIRRKFKEEKIFTKLTQTNLGNKIQQHLSNFEFINPAILAANEFVKPVVDAKITIQTIQNIQKQPFKLDPLLMKAVVFIFSIIFCSTVFFFFYEKLSLLDAFYFTITTMTTTGFGDISLLHSGALSKIFISLVMMASVTGTAMVFALIADSVLKKRQELMWGIKKYKGNGHIIVVGGGSVGYRVICKLIEMNEKVVLIDKDLNGPFIKEILELKVPLVIGDAKNNQLLINAGLERCKTVMALTENDLVNLEIGLDVKTVDQGLKVVLRIFEKTLSDSLRENNIIKHSYSMSYIAAEQLILQLEANA